MSDDKVDGAALDQLIGEDPGNDLRDAIETAFNDVTEADKETAAPDEAKGEDADAEDAALEAPPEDETGAEADAADGDQEDPEDSGDEPISIDPPEHWPADLKTKFTALSDDAKQAALEIGTGLDSVHNERLQGLEESEKALSRLQQLDEVLAPHREAMALEGVSEAQVVQRLMAAQAYLERDPKQAIKWLAQSYGVDIAGLNPQPDDEDVEFTDPAIQRVTEQVSGLEKMFQDWTQQQQRQAQQGHAQVLQQFQEAKDDQGNLLHPHFGKLKRAMGALMSQGQAESLEDAYQAAVWANPETRAQALADQERQRLEAEQQKQAEADAERKRRTEEARKSATVVKATPKSGAVDTNSAEPGEHLRDSLRKEWDRQATA